MHDQKISFGPTRLAGITEMSSLDMISLSGFMAPIPEIFTKIQPIPSITLPMPIIRKCSCLQTEIATNQKCRPLQDPECSLTKIINSSFDLKDIVSARIQQFTILKQQWRIARRIDDRCELLLDGVIEDIRKNLYPMPTAYKKKYDAFGTQLIGSGSNGRIYQATRKVDGLPVAVKIVLNMTEGVRREVTMLRHCYHPLYTVELLDAYGLSNEGIITIIVLRLEGKQWIDYPPLTCKRRVNVRDLHAYFTANSEIDDRDLCGIIHKLLVILNHLHQDRKVVHGDIKPANFVINADKSIKMIDMATCKSIRDGPVISSFKGTAGFASPAAMSGNPYEGRLNDLWGLGIMIYGFVYGAWRAPHFDENGSIIFPREKRLKLSNFVTEHIKGLINCLLDNKGNWSKVSRVYELHSNFWETMSTPNDMKDAIPTPNTLKNELIPENMSDHPTNQWIKKWFPQWLRRAN